jgi:ATP synthase protein I
MDNENRRYAVQMALASSIGIAMILAVVGCLLIGVYLDNRFDSGNVFKVVFLFIGLGAGFRNLYNLVKQNFDDDERIIKSLKREPHRQRPAAKKN